MKRGFTLIEVLGVIIILASIILIVVPVVSKTVRNNKKNQAINNTISYINTVESYAKSSVIDKNNSNGELGSGTFNVGNLNDLIETDGTLPTTGTVTINDDYKVTSAIITINNYIVIYNGKDDITATKS